MPIRLMLVDDQEVVRRGLCSLLAGSQIEIVGQASSQDEAIQKVAELRPDVVMMEFRMREGDGLIAIRDFYEQCKETRVIIFSTHDNPTYVARSVALGAAEYLLKGTAPNTIVHVIGEVAEGHGPSSDGLMFHIKEKMHQGSNGQQIGVSLTNREHQVLRHLALGLSNREIGMSLGISVETVKEHVQNILRKLKLSDRTQAAVWAVRRRFV